MGIAPLDRINELPYGRTLRILADRSNPEYHSVRKQWSGKINIQFSDGNRDVQHHMSETELKELEAVHALIRFYEAQGHRATMLDQMPDSIMSYHSFLQHGAQIFDFSAALVDELDHTDVDDVTTDEIEMPYPCFYLRIGSTLTDQQGRKIDGILVDQLSGVGTEANLINLVPFVATEDGVQPSGMTFFNQVDGRTVADAIDDMITERRKAEEENGVRFVQGNADYLEFTRSMEVMAAEIKRNLPLIVNMLLYIDACHERLKEGYPSEAPKDLAEKAMSDRPGARKARSTLLAQGWPTVYRCTLEAETGRPEEEGRRTVTGHWRRGHWRRQRHGPQNSWIKRVRIRATFVGAGEMPDSRKYSVAPARESIS